MHIDNPGVSRRYYDLLNEYKQADFFFLSFPKCGRTWVRYILGTYFHLVFGVHKTHKLNSTHVARMIERRNQGCPLISFTHDYFSLGDKITKTEFQKIESNIKDFVFKDFYTAKPTIILFRDPIDAVVSFYYNDINSKKPLGLSMIDWFKNDTFGLTGTLKWFDTAFELINHLPKKLVLSYENLKKQQGWEELIKFTTNNCKTDLLKESIEENKFEKAQAKEKQNRQTVITNNNKLFTRQGGSNYEENLSQEIKEYIDSIDRLKIVRNKLSKIYETN